MELWATGSRAFCQLDLRPIDGASDHVCEELEHFTNYTKIFACDGIRAHTLRAGQYRIHVQTLRAGKYFASAHEDVVLEMIEACPIRAEERAKLPGRYDQYADLIEYHMRTVVRGGLFAMSGAGVITDLAGRVSRVRNTPEGIKFEPLPEIKLPGVQHSGIVAGATHFAALCDGSVYTWGDPRYPAPLGRMDPDTRPADAPGTGVPGVVYDLEDLEDQEKVVKLAAGGYLTAALTKGGDCYVWGAPELGWSGSPEPLDFNVVDVAVGEQFIVLIAEKDGGARELWVRGKSRHGELGLGDEAVKIEDWTRVELSVSLDKELVQVVAGAGCVVLAVRTKNEGIPTPKLASQSRGTG